MTVSVCIFAHNEERLLPRCLEALDGAAAGADYVVHVIENGSTDDTARVARAFAAADARIRVHELALGDKANAWNEYVHRLAPEAALHVFVDGDVRPMKGAFAALRLALDGARQAYAAAGLPTTGRSRREWATRLYAERWLSGNLYALTAEALAQLRARDIRMPVGMIGEDGLLSYILVTDLQGGPDDSRRERIVIGSGAFFEFDSLAPTPRDAALYWRRLNAYSKRYFQNQILYPLLKEKGIAAMPDRIEEVMTAEGLAALRPRPGLRDHFIDRAVLKRLRAAATER